MTTDSSQSNKAGELKPSSSSSEKASQSVDDPEPDDSTEEDLRGLELEGSAVSGAGAGELDREGLDESTERARMETREKSDGRSGKRGPVVVGSWRGEGGSAIGRLVALGDLTSTGGRTVGVLLWAVGSAG